MKNVLIVKNVSMKFYLFSLELDDTIRTKDRLAKYCISKLQPEGKKNV